MNTVKSRDGQVIEVQVFSSAGLQDLPKRAVVDISEIERIGDAGEEGCRDRVHEQNTIGHDVLTPLDNTAAGI